MLALLELVPAVIAAPTKVPTDPPDTPLPPKVLTLNPRYGSVVVVPCVPQREPV